MRNKLTRERLQALMREIARVAPGKQPYQVYLVGGGTAVYSGWRASSIDADLFSEREEVFRDIQGIKERLNLNVEVARPEHFVPALSGSASRHIHIETIGGVTFYHYDPYAQVFSKLVRGFERDMRDVRQFVASGLVDPEELRRLVAKIPTTAFARYPNLTRAGVTAAVDAFLRETG